MPGAGVETIELLSSSDEDQGDEENGGVSIRHVAPSGGAAAASLNNTGSTRPKRAVAGPGQSVQAPRQGRKKSRRSSGESQAESRLAERPAAPRGVIDLTSGSVQMSVVGAAEPAACGPGARAATASAAVVATTAAPEASHPPHGWKCSICLDVMVRSWAAIGNYPRAYPRVTLVALLTAQVEPSSTNCGHMFCKGCIRQAVKATKKCPQVQNRHLASPSFVSHCGGITTIGSCIIRTLTPRPLCGAVVCLPVLNGILAVSEALDAWPDPPHLPARRNH
eukprot:COSAG05_NODE_5067_length_1273_cov_1.706985_1_plen_279_part_00